mmetsp:Transcript_5885/g.9535  ORF Transcript_5885/g.9535 Transcript_5885/m.9535 type:complete len:96 (+) Transcript_5885:989-1276(+)
MKENLQSSAAPLSSSVQSGMPGSRSTVMAGAPQKNAHEDLTNSAKRGGSNFKGQMCENMDNRFDETSSNHNGSSSGVVAGEFIPEAVIINTSGFS